AAGGARAAGARRAARAGDARPRRARRALRGVHDARRGRAVAAPGRRGDGRPARGRDRRDAVGRRARVRDPEVPARAARPTGTERPGRVGRVARALAMHETADDLRALQALLDRSFDAGGEHLRRILTPERRLDAEQLVDRLTGMTLLSLATVSRDGRPFVGPVDGV